MLIFHGNRRRKEVALTFDDGPSEETEKILKVLKKYGAKGTFFVLGERIKGREKTLIQLKREGHEIGNHGFSHKSLLFKSRSFIEKEIKKCDKLLEKAGIETYWVRFPYFHFGLNALVVCKKLGKKMIFADVVSNDWKIPFVNDLVRREDLRKKIIEKTVEKTKNGSILSFHDYVVGKGRNREIISIVEEIIVALKKKGFRFVTVSDVLKH